MQALANKFADDMTAKLLDRGQARSGAQCAKHHQHPTLQNGVGRRSVANAGTTTSAGLGSHRQGLGFRPLTNSWPPAWAAMRVGIADFPALSLITRWPT